MSPSAPQPRKVRSGRRQFPGAGPGPGSDQEWEKAMSDPQVQRALKDPQIQQALYHNLQSTVPGGMGSIMAPAAQAQPRRFDKGGSNDTSDAATATTEQLIEDQMAILRDPERSTPDKAKAQAKINQLRMAQAQAQVSGQPTAGLTLPGGVNVSGSSLSGLKQLAGPNAGPPTPGNMALTSGLGALMGAGATRGNVGVNALVGAGLAGGLNFLLRKYGKSQQKPKPMDEKPSADTSGGGSEQNVTPTDTSASTGTSSATGSSAPAAPTVSNLTTGYQPPAPPPAAGQGNMWTGTSNDAPSGNVVSYDGGKTWVDPNADPNKPKVAVPDAGVRNKFAISPDSSLTNATPATTPPAGAPNLISTAAPGSSLGTADIPASDTQFTQTDPSLSYMREGGLAEGGPHHAMALPVLHTTIVIAPKKKLAPRAPLANDERPRPHGRVQVPRGSGKAIRGKRFGGIF